MLLRVVGITVVLIASSMFGYSLSHDYLMRIKNLEQTKKMLLLLKGEIKHNNSGINESIINIASRLENVMGTFLEYIWKQFNEKDCSIREAWDMGIEKILKTKSSLKQEDILVIRDIGTNLGITDRDTQINNILNSMEIIELKIDELNQARGEKCRLYRTLGVMAGAFMAIVLI